MIDFQLLILMLRNHGKKTSVIAKDIGAGYHHVKRLASGETQKTYFDTAIKLIDYAYEHLPEDQFMRLKL